jgi:hypothetical protein
MPLLRLTTPPHFLRGSLVPAALPNVHGLGGRHRRRAARRGAHASRDVHNGAPLQQVRARTMFQDRCRSTLSAPHFPTITQKNENSCLYLEPHIRAPTQLVARRFYHHRRARWSKSAGHLRARGRYGHGGGEGGARGHHRPRPPLHPPWPPIQLDAPCRGRLEAATRPRGIRFLEGARAGAPRCRCRPTSPYHKTRPSKTL